MSKLIATGVIADKDAAMPPPSPFAKHQGILSLGASEIDCYVLDTGDRVLSMRSTVRTLTGMDSSSLQSYIGAQNLRPYFDTKKILGGAVEFHIPGTQFVGKGIRAEDFLEVCDGYVLALYEDQLVTDRQKAIAVKASMLVAACAKIGLIALIDEATGYQYERQADALQLKLRAYISEELRQWEKTFPDELWEEFGRLTNWNGPLHSRPKWWGKLVLTLIYDALDPDVAEHLRTTKPPPRHRQNYHQWLTENVGLKHLITHIHQVIGIAKTCQSINELRDKVLEHYGRETVQMTLMLPRS